MNITFSGSIRRNIKGPGDMFKLFITIRREELSEVEFKKLILIVDRELRLTQRA